LTQAVFLRRIVDPEALRRLVGTGGGLVHLGRRGEWTKWEFTPVMTRSQAEERRRRDLEVEAILSGSVPDEEATIDLQDLLEEMARRRRSVTDVFLRPPTKKSLREAVGVAPGEVFVQEISAFANEFEGWLDEAPEGRYSVVGPDPERSRRWFGAIRWSDRKKGWTVD
jgi:hypothetical protein